MSCNHSEARKAMQQANEMKATKKLLWMLLDKHAMAIVKAWEEVNLESHPCPVCKKHGLRLKATNGGKETYRCPGCETVFFK